MATSYLQHHMERSHGTLLPQIRVIYVGVGGPETYKVSLPQILKLAEFPVECFLERANTPGRLREHFMY